ncbi:uncharacterized protein N7483_002200 [Penicillium malachiteum]|uniref:uncharacterized protein n=1 Tax=Penicillium malachiteum TaxID=1324776 RepID=UPI002546862F|nr:uncharacterized protein N7483_002200 [Penicillium malachiteum]KAJ5737075.1 hypothetical protein N7483_002200 [Penicillium malachiteum]
MPTTIHILVYVSEPIDLIEYRHAGLFLKFPAGSSTLLNVEGAPGVFDFKPRDGYKPEDSRKLAATIPVADFPD